jgi:hypothetical protein
MNHWSNLEFLCRGSRKISLDLEVLQQRFIITSWLESLSHPTVCRYDTQPATTLPKNETPLSHDTVIII